MTLRDPCRLAFVLVAMLATSSLRAANPPIDAASVRSGAWSDLRTWADGRAPRPGDRVQVRPGHVVTYDVASDDPIRMIHVAGTLTFSRQKSTRLCVGLIKVQAGLDATEEGFDCDAHAPAADTPAAGAPRPALEIGTAEDPIPAGITATIRLTYFPGMDKETLPAIVDCGGRWDVHGAPMRRTWVKLGAPAMAGADTVTLAEDPGGWKAGDRIVLTASYKPEFRPADRPDVGAEERIIASIDGTALRLDKPLDGDHVAAGPTVTEAANLSRNVVIESADPEGVAGHTMYRRNSSGSISYAEFRDLGKERTLGKYPIHFHMVRDTMRGSAVIGASIWNSRNRFMAIHGTDYLLVRDCVGFRALGHGFFLEDATEQYNVLDRNIAIQAVTGQRLREQVLDFDQNEGAGFWWANGRNALTRNVSSECGYYGFRFQIKQVRRKDPVFTIRQPDGSAAATDIRSIPFLRFEDNESHCDGIYAFSFGDDPAGSVGSDARHPFIARNLRAWQVHFGLRPNLRSLLVDGLRVDRATAGIRHPDYDDHVYRNVHLSAVTGEPIDRGHDDESIQHGSFTFDRLTLENCRTGGEALIQLACTSPKPGRAGHFRNLTIKDGPSDIAVVDLGAGGRNRKLENAVAYYFHGQPKDGRALKVASAGFPKFLGERPFAATQFIGKDVQAIEVDAPPFPELLDPVDDLPPATIITAVRRQGDGLIVRGVSVDDGRVASVTVNGQPATILESNAGIADWEVRLPRPADDVLRAAATDAAGNVEKTPAVAPAGF